MRELLSVLMNEGIKQGQNLEYVGHKGLNICSFFATLLTTNCTTIAPKLPRDSVRLPTSPVDILLIHTSVRASKDRGH